MAYPKPGPVGGKLIRSVVANLRAAKVNLPLSSHILIATSGGADSIALAHLIVRYGRRVGGRVSLLHINHHWRGAESDADQEFVEKMGAQWGVEVLVRHIDASNCPKGESIEAYLSRERAKIYDHFTRAKKWIFTAHTADDLAETLLWRLFTGSSERLGGGIYLKKGRVLRPLLNLRKTQLLVYLREEGLTYREDKTNLDTRYTRAYIRAEILPKIEERFPRAVDEIVKAGLKAQRIRFTNAKR